MISLIPPQHHRPDGDVVVGADVAHPGECKCVRRPRKFQPGPVGKLIVDFGMTDIQIFSWAKHGWRNVTEYLFNEQ